jgi:hypothetical protein
VADRCLDGDSLAIRCSCPANARAFWLSGASWYAGACYFNWGRQLNGRSVGPQGMTNIYSPRVNWKGIA